MAWIGKKQAQRSWTFLLLHQLKCETNPKWKKNKSSHKLSLLMTLKFLSHSVGCGTIFVSTISLKRSWNESCLWSPYFCSLITFVSFPDCFPKWRFVSNIFRFEKRLICFFCRKLFSKGKKFSIQLSDFFILLLKLSMTRRLRGFSAVGGVHITYVGHHRCLVTHT